MSKHIVVIALEVDEKYSASDVKKEIAYGVEFFSSYFSSEIFDTLSGIFLARNPIKTYQVWSREHVAMIGNVTIDNHAELVAFEESTNYSYSSFVTTDDIEAFVDAVNNEFNGDLQYQHV